MKVRFAAVACAALITMQFSPVAHADALSFAQAGMRHCGGDVSRLCSGVFPGGGRIAQCLLNQYERLSPSCRSFVDKGRSAQRVLFACEADAQRFCSDVPRGQGRVVFCLNDNRQRISRSCAHALDRAETALRQ